jgi:hypothetical protein
MSRRGLRFWMAKGDGRRETGDGKNREMTAGIAGNIRVDILHGHGRDKVPD